MRMEPGKIIELRLIGKRNVYIAAINYWIEDYRSINFFVCHLYTRLCHQ